MDRTGCWRDNVFIERLWRSVTYDGVALRADEAVSVVRVGIHRYFTCHNQRRPHSRLGCRTPDAEYDAVRPLTPVVSSRDVPLVQAA